MMYPGFYIALATLAAGGLCATMSLAALKDKDYLGSGILCCLSASILVYFFS